MVRKKTPRVRRLAALCAVFLVGAVAMLPCFAFGAVQPPPDGTTNYNFVYNPLALDTFVIDPETLAVNLASPFYHGITNDGFQLEEMNELEIMYIDPSASSGVSPETESLYVVPGNVSQLETGVFHRSFTVECSNFSNNYLTFAFTNSSEFLSNMQMFNYMSNSVISVPSNVTFERSVYVYGHYPVANSLGGYDFVPFEQEVYYTFTNSNQYAVAEPLFPTLSEYDVMNSLLSDVGFIVEGYALVVRLSGSSSVNIGAVQFTMPYIWDALKPEISAFALDYGYSIIVEPGQPGDAGFELGTFLRNSVGNFLDTEIAPGLSLAGIMAAVIGIMLFFAFLKIFAGG